jgi:hypothetical protein
LLRKPPTRKLNRRAASLPLATLVSLDSFALPFAATGGGKATSPTGEAGREDNILKGFHPFNASPNVVQ